MKARRVCELCNGEAALYCGSDSAFLCWACDAKVHEANFLVARHLRLTICRKCDGFDGSRVSGVGSRPPRRPICRSCAAEPDDLDGYESSTTSSSSTCVSTAESVTGTGTDAALETKKACSSSSASEVSDGSPASAAAGKRRDRARPRRICVDSKAEEVLMSWCRRLGLRNRRTAAIASRALSVCLREVRVSALPSKVLIASSLWMAWKADARSSSSLCEKLRRVEEVSGVAAKVISMAESKVARALLLKRRYSNGGGGEEEEEGWAECSN